MNKCKICGEKIPESFRGRIKFCSEKCRIEAKREQKRNYYHRNYPLKKEMYDAIKKRYAEKNPEAYRKWRREYQRAYYQKHKEKIKEINKRSRDKAKAKDERRRIEHEE